MGLPRGSERRTFFNALSGWLVAGVALGCGAAGFRLSGPIGAALGLALGLRLGAAIATRGGFLRP